MVNWTSPCICEWVCKIRWTAWKYIGIHNFGLQTSYSFAFLCCIMHVTYTILSYTGLELALILYRLRILRTDCDIALPNCVTRSATLIRGDMTVMVPEVWCHSEAALLSRHGTNWYKPVPVLIWLQMLLGCKTTNRHIFCCKICNQYIYCTMCTCVYIYIYIYISYVKSNLGQSYCARQDKLQRLQAGVDTIVPGCIVNEQLMKISSRRNNWMLRIIYTYMYVIDLCDIYVTYLCTSHIYLNPRRGILKWQVWSMPGAPLELLLMPLELILW